MALVVCASSDGAAGSKRVFDGFLHTNRPTTLEETHGFWRLNFVNRTTYNATDWTDDTGLPPDAWYATVAATYTNAHNYLLLDIESWPIDTQANRLATAQKFVTVYQEMKRRRPDLQIGFYAYTPNRDFFRATEITAGKSDWQAENDDMAALYGAVDFFAPSLYFFYTRSQGGGSATNVESAHEYFVENLVELKRCRAAYGHNQPIYPYVWFRRHDGAVDLDLDVWEDMAQTAHLEADGMILWGGFGQTWSDFSHWWINFNAAFPFGDRTLLKPRAVRQ
ncbi:MAG: hypothetical protein ACYCZR_00965 [Burkholderiales bacterium]